MTEVALITLVVSGVEIFGVGAIVLGALIATIEFLFHLRPPSGISDAYRIYRRGIGRSILLGLEFLVAADIIRTVAVSPTFANVGILAAIVLIRTFLSMTLELEVNGRWPWQQPPGTTDQP